MQRRPPGHGRSWSHDHREEEEDVSSSSSSLAYARPARWQPPRYGYPTWLYGEDRAPLVHPQSALQQQQQASDERYVSVARQGPPRTNDLLFTSVPARSQRVSDRRPHSHAPLPSSSASAFTSYASAVAAAPVAVGPQRQRDSFFQAEDSGEDDEQDDASDGITSTVAARKASRYLREIDRREILRRLAEGERQTALAKEFHVSRAAISNLQKHRDEVLARDENPYSKHPKTKQRAKAQRRRQLEAQDGQVSALVPPPSSSTHPLQATQQAQRQQQEQDLYVHEVATIAIRELLASLRQRDQPVAAIQRNHERLLWLMMEEALAMAPTESTASSGHSGHRVVTQGYATIHPPCGVVIDSADAMLLLRVFTALEPTRPVGVARVHEQDDGQLYVEMVGTSLPAVLDGFNVFVMDGVATDAAAVCAVLATVQQGAPASVFFVSTVVTPPVVAAIRHRHPRVTVVTAVVEQQ